MQKQSVFRKVISLKEAQAILEQMRLDKSFPSGSPDLDELTGGLVREGAELIVAKSPTGTVGTIHLDRDDETDRFTEPADH